MSKASECAKRIKELAKSTGISVNKLLIDCKMSKSMIYDMEKRNAMPSADKLQKISDYFHVSMGYLLMGTEPEEETKEDEIDRQLEGHRYALQSLDPNAVDDLTLGEKKDVLKFINFLKSQRKFSDQQEEGKSGDKS